MKIAAHSYLKAELPQRLPADVEIAWFDDADGAERAVADVEAVLLDLLNGTKRLSAVIERGERLKWIASSFAGIERYPVDLIARRNILFTHGGGINAVAVAEWAVMGVYTQAKGFPEVVRMHDGASWSTRPFGTVQVLGSKVLLIGYGYIGKEIARQLEGVGAEVTVVRSRPDPERAVLGPDEWRPRLAEFDFVILAAPALEETRHMIGAAELKAMKEGASLINIARGALVDQEALIDAMSEGRIAGALLDTTDPEPLPADHPLWRTPGITVTAHLSGRSTRVHSRRAAELFADNLRLYQAGQPMINLVDPERGY